MTQNVPNEERLPRIAVAIAAGIGAAFVPTLWLKTGLFAVAAGLLTTVATGYCPLTEAMQRGDAEPGWRTLKTYRVEP
jgi:hypothetical protein